MADPTPDLEVIKYPIGRFHFDATEAPKLHAQWLQQLQALPTELAKAVAGLNDKQLDTAYRDGGWTLRQVVHHLADSHMNSYIRMRLALTETLPVVKPYDENAWAELPDAQRGPIAPSMQILSGVHARWVALLQALPKADFAREFDHPQSGRHSLAWALAHYAWHGKQHCAHIAGLRRRLGW